MPRAGETQISCNLSNSAACTATWTFAGQSYFFLVVWIGMHQVMYPTLSPRPMSEISVWPVFQTNKSIEQIVLCTNVQFDKAHAIVKEVKCRSDRN